MPQAKINLAEALKKMPLFNDLAEEEHELLGERALRHHFKADGPIFSEGEQCSGLYIIEAGRVRLFGSSTSGREQILAIQGPGSTVGELAALDGGNYPASARAFSDADLVFIRREDLQSLCLKHPRVAVKLLEVVASRVRPLISMVGQLSFSTVRQRLVAFLLRLAAQEGKLTARGVEFKLTSTNRDLAAQIGTVPELVSRNLGSLQASGLIQIRGKTVIIPNPEAAQVELEHPH
jgi:CRP/FNR family transcriptional regulator, dissimilatory nitrate respiration regulator